MRGFPAWLAAFLAAGVVEAADLAPPAPGSVAEFAERMAEAIGTSRSAGPLLGVPAEVIDRAAACDGIATAVHSCTVEVLNACASSLLALEIALREASGRGDSFSRASARNAAAEITDVGIRLSGLLARARDGDCGQLAPPGAVPARIVVSGDRRTLSIRPLATLRPGRRWALVAEGMPEEGSHEPTPEEQEQSGFLVAPRIEALGQAADAYDLEGYGAWLSMLERRVRALPGRAVFAGVQVRWPEPFALAPSETRRFYFVQVPDEVPPGALSIFRTIDGRSGLVDNRARLRVGACATPIRLGETGRVDSEGRTILRGVYRSLDITSGAGEAHPLGIPAADAVPVDLPLQMVVPGGLTPTTPLVIGVDGHTGSATRFLGEHGPGLVDRGMAFVSIDLPDHGERIRRGRAFFEREDPGGLVRNIRQSATDVVGLVAALRRCGVRLPDGTFYRPGEVRYLGYSLGAMVGVLVRSIEPELGTTVLLAGAGDLPGWLTILVVPPFRDRYVSCIGGADHGASCFPGGDCAPPGRCDVDPHTQELIEASELLFALAVAGGDPLEFASVRTGEVSRAPLLLVTGARDGTLSPVLSVRLAGAYGMRPAGDHLWRGPHSFRVHWPGLGHELSSIPAVREQAYEFLESEGRRVLGPASSPDSAPDPDGPSVQPSGK